MTTARAPYCLDTYTDALTYTQERRDAEVGGILDFLRTNYDRTAPIDTFDGLFLELRAYRYASIDAPRGAA